MITADYINDLCTRSYTMAKEKGWWEAPRTPYELGNLCHSELSEALEELRSGHAVTEIYFKGDKPTKPEGFPTELADFVIRLADWAESIGEKCDLHQWGLETELQDAVKGADVQVHIAMLHNLTSQATSELVQGAPSYTSSLTIPMVFAIAKAHGIDLPAAIEQKMTYNATRPIRHGREF